MIGLPPVAEPRPVTIKGTGGAKKTKPFSMVSGDYTVVIKGKSTGTYDNVQIEMLDPAGDYDELLVNEIKDGRGSYRYDTNLYGVPGGKFYLDVAMPPGTWSVTFTPQ